MQRLIGLVLLFGVVACTTTPNPERADPRIYQVRPGDTLSSIARRSGVPLVYLQWRNVLLDLNQLGIGQRLVLPMQVPEYVWPLGNVDISSGFRHPRPTHQGIDLRAPRGTPIHAARAGRVTFVGRQSGFGNLVIIEHEDGLQSWYAHNDRNLVEVGKWVEQGQAIARVGRSGNATGYHLHMEFRRNGQSLDPLTLLPS